MNLKEYVRDIPDFPTHGILFKDITPILQNAQAFQYAIDELSNLAKASDAEGIVGIESRGFIFGAPVANKLGLPFIPVRKPGKLPYARKSVEYSLEYGSGQLDIHEDALTPGQKVVVIDDLLATGGTARAAAELVELIQGAVVQFLFVIDLSFLGGREKLADYNTNALITY